MILAFKLADIIQIPFGYLLSWLYQLTTNYGLALIIFAIVLKFILLPATAKGKKSTMKMSGLTPKLQALQKKYAGDQQKLNEAAQAVFGTPCDIIGCSRTDSGVHANMFCITISHKGTGILRTSIHPSTIT